nr:hypothetical protein [uncultured Methanolobus sp.]
MSSFQEKVLEFYQNLNNDDELVRYGVAHSIMMVRNIAMKLPCLEFKNELLAIIEKYENIVLHDDEAYRKLTVGRQ